MQFQVAAIQVGYKAADYFRKFQVVLFLHIYKTIQPMITINKLY